MTPPPWNFCKNSSVLVPSPSLIEFFKPSKPSFPIEQYSQFLIHDIHSLQPNFKQSSIILYQGVVKEIVAKNQDAGVAIIAFAKPAVSCILPVWSQLEGYYCAVLSMLNFSSKTDLFHEL